MLREKTNIEIGVKAELNGKVHKLVAAHSRQGS